MMVYQCHCYSNPGSVVKDHQYNLQDNFINLLIETYNTYYKFWELELVLGWVLRVFLFDKQIPSVLCQLMSWLAPVHNSH